MKHLLLLSLFREKQMKPITKMNSKPFVNNKPANNKRKKKRRKRK
jgi:hypothetical protein